MPKTWPSFTPKLTSARACRLPKDFETPSVTSIIGDCHGGEPSPWQRALAAQLSYRFARIGRAEAWALHEPEGAERRGSATWLLRVRGNQARDPHRLCLEVPAPRWERGVLDAALTLYQALDADAILLAGAVPSVAVDGSADVRRASGIRSFYQHAHEVWIQAGGRAVGIHAIAPTRPLDEDSIVTFESEASDALAGPDWTQPIVRMLHNNGLTVAAVDGSVEREPYDGATNPPLLYARRFGRAQMMLLWLSSDVRSLLLSAREDELTRLRAQRAGLAIATTEVAARSLQLAGCGRQARSERTELAQTCPPRKLLLRCEVERTVGQLLEYTRSSNPYALRAALPPQGTCHVEVTQDQRSGRLWALIAGAEHTHLVPLRRAPTRRSRRALADQRAIEAALAIGISTIRVEAGR